MSQNKTKTYKGNQQGELWLWVGEEKTVLLETFSTEVDSVRAAMLLNEMLPSAVDDGFDQGYDLGYTQGFREGTQDAERRAYYDYEDRLYQLEGEQLV